jgi:hypothetical protein
MSNPSLNVLQEFLPRRRQQAARRFGKRLSPISCWGRRDVGAPVEHLHTNHIGVLVPPAHLSLHEIE